MSSASSDEDLAQAWANGDRQAGESLFARYYPRLSRFFRDKVGDTLNLQEDLLSQVFLALLERPHGFRQQGSFRAYVFGIARHLLYKAFRAHGRRRAHEVIGEISLAQIAPQSSRRQASPSAWLVRRERDAQILRALRELPLDLQIALEMHYWEAMGAQDIADVLDLPLGTAKTRLRRAKLLLAVALDDLRENR